MVILILLFSCFAYAEALVTSKLELKRNEKVNFIEMVCQLKLDAEDEEFSSISCNNLQLVNLNFINNDDIDEIFSDEIKVDKILGNGPCNFRFNVPLDNLKLGHQYTTFISYHLEGVMMNQSYLVPITTYDIVNLQRSDIPPVLSIINPTSDSTLPVQAHLLIETNIIANCDRGNYIVTYAIMNKDKSLIREIAVPSPEFSVNERSTNTNTKCNIKFMLEIFQDLKKKTISSYVYIFYISFLGNSAVSNELGINLLDDASLSINKAGSSLPSLIELDLKDSCETQASPINCTSAELYYDVAIPGNPSISSKIEIFTKSSTTNGCLFNFNLEKLENLKNKEKITVYNYTFNALYECGTNKRKAQADQRKFEYIPEPIFKITQASQLLPFSFALSLSSFCKEMNCKNVALSYNIKADTGNMITPINIQSIKTVPDPSNATNCLYTSVFLDEKSELRKKIPVTYEYEFKMQYDACGKVQALSSPKFNIGYSVIIDPIVDYKTDYVPDIKQEVNDYIEKPIEEKIAELTTYESDFESIDFEDDDDDNDNEDDMNIDEGDTDLRTNNNQNRGIRQLQALGKKEKFLDLGIKINTLVGKTDCSKEDEQAMTECSNKRIELKNKLITRFVSRFSNFGNSDVMKQSKEIRRKFSVLFSAYIKEGFQSPELFNKLNYDSFSNFYGSTLKNITSIITQFKVEDDEFNKEFRNSRVDFLNSLILSYDGLIDILKSNIKKDETSSNNSSLIIDKDTLSVRSQLSSLVNSYVFEQKETDLIYRTESFKAEKHIINGEMPIILKDLIGNNEYIFEVQFEKNPLLENEEVLVVLNKKYPLHSNDSYINFSRYVVSLSLDNKNEGMRRRLYDLKSKVVFRLAKENDEFNTCLYFDERYQMWSGEGCISKNLHNGYVECTCNHLTDFTLGLLDPRRIIEDIKHIWLDLRYMNSWDEFRYLSFHNSTAIYITLIGFLIIGLGHYMFRFDGDLSENYLFPQLIVHKKTDYCSFKMLVSKILLFRRHFWALSIRTKSASFDSNDIDSQISLSVSNESDHSVNNREHTYRNYENKLKYEFKLSNSDIFAKSIAYESDYHALFYKNDYITYLSHSEYDKGFERFTLLQTPVKEKVQLTKENLICLLYVYLGNSNTILCLVSKANFKCLKVHAVITFIFRFLVKVNVASLLSPCNSNSGNKYSSSSGYSFSNRSLAVSVLSNLVCFVPLYVMSRYFNKVDVDCSFDCMVLDRLKIKVKRIRIVIWVIMVAVITYGTLNTTWITIRNDMGDRENTFYKDLYFLVLLELMNHCIKALIGVIFLYNAFNNIIGESQLQRILRYIIIISYWLA